MYLQTFFLYSSPHVFPVLDRWALLVKRASRQSTAAHTDKEYLLLRMQHDSFCRWRVRPQNQKKRYTHTHVTDSALNPNPGPRGLPVVPRSWPPTETLPARRSRGHVWSEDQYVFSPSSRPENRHCCCDVHTVIMREFAAAARPPPRLPRGPTFNVR